MLFCPGVASAIELPEWHGFIEHDFGLLLRPNSLIKHEDYNMLEQRFQLKTRYPIPGENLLSDWNGVFTYKGDFLLDEYFNTTGSYEIRELNFAFSPFNNLDIKAGRQILTWGTGDYLFLNDLFPKDYVSFYIGRDDEYLKKPSDALKISAYPKIANVDFVFIPHFTSNTLPEGDRLSFFDSFQGEIVGRDSQINAVKPAWKPKNFEYALRIYRTFGSTEGALYYFRGFDPSPRGYLNEDDQQLFYERLDVYGASVRGPFAQGIGNIEGGYYYSPQDSAGNNRLIENSAFKILLGYEKELGNDFKVGLQYQYEQKLNYTDYISALTPQDYYWDKNRHLLTQRLTKFFKNQTVMLGLFNFWSPSDKDGYLRASCAYDISDQWKFTFGVNIPWGEDDTTEFGMMRNNKNVFMRIRYSF
jgi:hypothetical protein